MMDRINKATPVYVAGYLSNGKPITEANIQEILNSVQETMPEDTRWDSDNFFNYNSAKLFSGPACSSFACGLSDFIFGEDAPVTKHQNFDKLKVGDVVWMKNVKTDYSHAFVVTSLSNPYWGPDSYSTCDGNSGGKVTWNGHGEYGTFEEPEIASATWIYSRY